MDSMASGAVDPQIEAAYADIGRMVVEQAMASSGKTNEAGEVEVQVNMRLKVGQNEAAGMRSVVCCVCTLDSEGVVTCKGPCCQYD